MRRMLSPSSKQCAIGACIAAGSLLLTAPAFAQTGTGTGAKTAPAKSDPKKEPTKPPAEPTPAEAQAAKKAGPVDAEKTEDGEEKESKRAVFVSGDLAFARVD